MEGLALNEISGSENGWIELYNTTVREINISGLKIIIEDDYYVDKTIYKASAKTTIDAGAYMVLSRQNGDLDSDIKIATILKISLLAADGTIVDTFVKNKDIGEGKSPSDGGSYARLPDGKGTWYHTKTATPNEENFGYTNRNAIWIWSTHAPTVNLENFANNGIHHILVNEVFFKERSPEQYMAYITKAEALGLTIHVWFQCFYDSNGWVSPVDDNCQCYDQPLYDAIIQRAENYVRLGIKGIHFDYIRFGGTASLHDFPEKGVTGEGAITEFCRQISEALRRINKHVILSAALMPERNSERYYGQNPASMGQYLDILMPMIYRYTEGSGQDKGALWSKGMADYFADRSGNAEVWAGLTTYKYVGATLVGLSKEEMLADCRVFLDTKASGLVLFRYALGNICDLTDFWDI